MSDSTQDKQLPATERRLKKARDEGQVARSRDLAHFVVVAAALLALAAVAPTATRWLRDLVASGLTFDHEVAKTPAMMLERLGSMVPGLVVASLGLGVLIGAVAVLAAWVSGGWVFTLHPVMPNFGKLNPLSGLAGLLSKDKLGDMLKSCVLALLLGVVGGVWLWFHRDDFMRVQAVGLPAAFAEVSDLILSGVWMLTLVLALFAVIDLPLQRFLHASRLKMSHQEVKEEHKQQEGNPQIKGRIRQRMLQMSRRRMMAAVPKADLVVMNPTHYAVALKYDEAQGGAPRVVAKGIDAVAMKIRELASQAQVPVLEAPALARALYATTELEREIPLALYSAVAQVLAHVFRLREAMAGRAAYPVSFQPVAVPPELDPADPRYLKPGKPARRAEPSAP